MIEALGIFVQLTNFFMTGVAVVMGLALSFYLASAIYRLLRSTRSAGVLTQNDLNELYRWGVNSGYTAAQRGQNGLPDHLKDRHSCFLAGWWDGYNFFDRNDKSSEDAPGSFGVTLH